MRVATSVILAIFEKARGLFLHRPGAQPNGNSGWSDANLRAMGKWTALALGVDATAFTPQKGNRPKRRHVRCEFRVQDARGGDWRFARKVEKPVTTKASTSGYQLVPRGTRTWSFARKYAPPGLSPDYCSYGRILRRIIQTRGTHRIILAVERVSSLE